MSKSERRQAALTMLLRARPFAIHEETLWAWWSDRPLWKLVGRLNINRMVRNGLVARNPTTRECLITDYGKVTLHKWEKSHD